MVASLTILAPGSALALQLGSTSSTGVSLEVGAQVFTRARGRRPDGGDLDWDLDLTRARLKTSIRYGKWIRADLEPDFGGANADLADAFLEVAPLAELDVRLGQMKVPFGELEWEGRWRLPVLSRGIVSDVVADRLGFGRRKLGGRVRLQLDEVTWRPQVEVGAFGDASASIGDDLVTRISVRPLKGLWARLTGYARDGATSDGGRGYASSLAATYDRKRIYGSAELMFGWARLLSATGVDTGADATFFAVRLLAAYAFRPTVDLKLEPFLAGELIDPNSATQSDLSVAFRGGLNLYWHERFRLSAELDRQTGQLGSVVNSRTTVTMLAGISLE